MVDSEKNSCVQDAWSWGEMWFRSEPGVGGLGRREGAGEGCGRGEWAGRVVSGGGGGGGGWELQLCTQQVTVQCVVRAAAKHWASGLQGRGGR